MKWWKCILALACLNTGNAMDPDMMRAQEHVEKAVLALPAITKAKKIIEKKIIKKIKQTGITDDQLTVTTIIVKSMSSKTISTKGVNIKVKTLGGQLDPSVEWNWSTGNTIASVNLSWSW